MKTIVYEATVRYEVEVSDEDGDASDIEQMKDDLEAQLCRINEFEFGYGTVRKLEIKHVP